MLVFDQYVQFVNVIHDWVWKLFPTILSVKAKPFHIAFEIYFKTSRCLYSVALKVAYISISSKVANDLFAKSVSFFILFISCCMWLGFCWLLFILYQLSHDTTEFIKFPSRNLIKSQMYECDFLVRLSPKISSCLGIDNHGVLDGILTELVWRYPAWYALHVTFFREMVISGLIDSLII